MARFNTGTGSSEDTPAVEVPGARPKVPVHPTFSSGPPLQAKKHVLESSLSGGVRVGGTPKPNFLKGTASTTSAPEVCEFPRPKPLAGKFGAPQDEGKPAVAKQPAFKPKPPDLSRDSEPKPLIPKVPVQKPSLSGTPEGKSFPKPPLALAKPPPAQAKPPLAQAKPSPAQPKQPPALTKPPLALAKPPPSQTKPPWVKDDAKSEDGGAGAGLNAPKMPLAPKPKSSVIAMRTQVEDGGDPALSPLKASSFRAAKSLFNKDSIDSQGPEKSGPSPLNSHDPPGPKPSFAPRASFVKTQRDQKENANPSAPKRNPLLNKLALGNPPAKPNRPPSVNLEKFRKQAENPANGPGMKKGSPLPPPPPSNHVAPPLPSHASAPSLPSPASAPSLPPRPTAAMIQPDPDENYDDVGVMSSLPPPPPGGHPSQTAEDSESDGEMYEDLEERWSAAESKEQEKKREKEEKKRIEQEKKEQKEREKKEQEARKKFKLSGPIEVIHKLKAKVDCKGSKTDLCLKQGDLIEIVRISDNPEGRWLGRTREGSFGYVKTESVEINFDALKRQGASLPVPGKEDLEVYDDVGAQDDIISVKGPGVVLPPPPDEAGEIYDDLEDLDLNVSDTATELRSPPKLQGFLKMFKSLDDWRKSPTSNNEVPPPPQFTPAGSAEKPEALIEEEIYDDVDSQTCAAPAAPAAPAAIASLGSLLQKHSKAKTEEKDPKKQKKFEKEEKEFRKKFKFDGEIQVLYQVTIISPLTNKKWGNKDLPLRPGETVDVIVKPADNKLIGRNEEGKFGYVSTSHIVAEDADIYDDIGEDCIYDND
ncbi:FYN-binding protein 1 isoform X2 [Anguilla rostrata]